MKKEVEEGGGGGGGLKKKLSWVDEMEVYSRSTVNLEEMEVEMDRRRNRLEERCEEALSLQQKNKEINSKEFLISNKYKLIWCNIFKAASSTWMYNYLKMAGLTEDQLKRERKSPVEAARVHYPRPSLELLRTHLEGRSDGYLSFIIVREPFQRLLSAYRDKIEPEVLYYRPLRCSIVKKFATPSITKVPGRYSCKPTFSQFVSYVLDEEKEGRIHNEHWAPYYRFCSPCQAHFDVIMRFESLSEDEVYLLQKVPSLSQVVSPKVIHSSHTNYTALTATYYKQLTAYQLLGLLKMYLPDFRLFGYSERPYLDYVLK